ncbi:hypothetical protein B0H17DRAFT_1127172 [Mycena rosella]|uniref:Uncharacterized protein n=1 Tax=Mycena rosella TaxID=1033263 RepID=A0AAD7E0Z8_MYCRO|nr:hypothetical protein B0H17DRAFT_1127172 [Mycena rosella]
MNFSHHLLRNTHRWRGGEKFSFNRQAFSPALHSKEPYPFVDNLVHQNQCAIHREEHDPVYCGDVSPADSFLLRPVDTSGLSDTEDEEDELTDDDMDTCASSPSRASSLFSSPLIPVPPSREPSPTITEIVNNQAPLLTYAKQDRKPGAALCAEYAKKRALAKRADAHMRILSHQLGYSRRSGHNTRGCEGDDVDGMWTHPQLLEFGLVIHHLEPETLTLLIDKNDYVMAVIAGAPKGRTALWDSIMKHTEQVTRRLYRNGHFDDLGHEETHHPYRIKPHSSNGTEVAYIQQSQAFGMLSAYQNHLFEQIASKLYHEMAKKVQQLADMANLGPAFAKSVFTTSEIAFCDVPNLSRKNPDATFTGGTYGWKKRDRIIFWDGGKVVPLRPRSTVLFPAGSKRFLFVPVHANKMRLIFRQYCHASVMHWIEKGRRLHSDFDLAPQEERNTWKAQQATHGQKMAKLYTKINDVYVF